MASIVLEQGMGKGSNCGPLAFLVGLTVLFLAGLGCAVLHRVVIVFGGAVLRSHAQRGSSAIAPLCDLLCFICYVTLLCYAAFLGCAATLCYIALLD